MALVQMPRGLRERKKERTRDDIVRAAWDLFRTKGYDATTVEEIAANADISRRTFFRYFPTKEAVVFHDSGYRLGLFRSLLRDRRADERPFDAVTRACLGIARHYVEHREEVLEQYRLIESSPVLVMRESEIDREWLASIAETLSQARSTSRDRLSRILAGAVFGAMRATLAEWLASAGKADLVALGTEAMSIFSPEAIAAPRSGSRTVSRARVERRMKQ